MNCEIVVQTECCKNNCSKTEEPSHPEYEVDNSDEETEEEDENLENISTKTLID
jgi:hypothetical protein